MTAVDDTFALAESLCFGNLQTPARQIPTTAAAAVVSVSAPGGPVVSVPSGMRSVTAPAMAVADSEGRAGSASPGAVPTDVPAVRARDDGRAAGAGGAATFTLPPIPTVPSFDNRPRP